MAEVLILKDGSRGLVSEPRDVIALVYDKLGFDAAKYIENLVSRLQQDLEDTEKENAEYHKQLEGVSDTILTAAYDIRGASEHIRDAAYSSSRKDKRFRELSQEILTWTKNLETFAYEVYPD